MGIIKRTDAAAKQDVVAIDLADIANEAAKIKQHARDEAARIIAEARAERERLIADADERGYQEGFERGQAEGIAKGTESGKQQATVEHAESIRSIVEAWADALDAFTGSRESMLEAARVDVVRLAALVAERVTKRSVELDPDACVAQLASLLEIVGEPTKLTIRVSELDEPILREQMPELLERFRISPSIEFVVVPELACGSCELVTNDGTRFDARLESQIARVIRTLLPGGVLEPSSSQSGEQSQDQNPDDQQLGDLAA